ncbi:MAG: DUF302 domain-containing protein [Halobacteria archaeon]|nr:DUF302 domain-containing protein [Halobacteria archaeon]
MLRIVLMGILVLTSACVSAGPPRSDYMKLYTVEGDFDNVRLDIEMAITDRGMIINNVSHIGNMLARTGKDLGAGKQIFKQAEALEFCSATVSRRMMETDPHNIVFCPYIIAIYTLPAEEDKVYVAFRRPLPVGSDESRQSLLAVEKLLDDIIADATL